MIFREDEQRKRANHAAANFAIVRKLWQICSKRTKEKNLYAQKRQNLDAFALYIMQKNFVLSKTIPTFAFLKIIFVIHYDTHVFYTKLFFWRLKTRFGAIFAERERERESHTFIINCIHTYVVRNFSENSIIFIVFVFAMVCFC